ncbi:ribosome biogenesis protein SLX9 homolog isoform X1 [Kogia breviceps]|uniref:ribosome biogenesis protein SLX9 homolog isoform X1 n=1 Tax=Kogia breviceps TaxID=27615 RepID=UPI0034D2C73F
MGKVRALRSRVHKAAVRPTGEAAPGPAPPAREAASLQASAGGVGGKEWAFTNASVFAGTTIDPSALVQKLDVDPRSSASVRRGAKAKAVLPKKEKLKLRRERWLQKIEAARLAEQRREAERRRRATVVVGDLQPLRDALPELRGLETAGQRCVPVKFGEESASPSSLVMPTASLGTARPLLGRPRGPGQPSRAGRARHRGSGSSRRKGRGFRSCWPARPTEPTPCRSPGSSWPSRCGWRVAGSPDATWGRPRGGAQGPNSAVVALLRQPLSNGAAVLGTGGSTGVRQAVDVVVL